MAAILETHPCPVFEDRARVLGYACGSRPAYRWRVETAVWRTRPVIGMLLVAATLASSPALASPRWPQTPAVDAEVARLMRETGAKGLAIAIVDGGVVRYVQAFGVRNMRGEPLTPETVMYGASLTKPVFAYAALQLVDKGKLHLDRPIAAMLARPLVDYPPDARYAPWRDLRGDDRWRLITPRQVLTHSTGLPNYAALEDDRRLHIHFEPGTRYAYSGVGMSLLQFGLEQGAGIDVGTITDAVFRRLRMTRTHLVWRADFAQNLADGWNDRGQVEPHAAQDQVRAASSMDTTITDMANFAAALVRCEGLKTASCRRMTGPQLHITSKHQFPTLRADLQMAPADQRSDLAAGLGLIVFDGPQGHGFYKAGHDSSTANIIACLRAQKRCVVVLANDVRAEKGFQRLVTFVLGETALPFDWEYGDQAGKS